MTRIEYDILRANRPELKLWHWSQLLNRGRCGIEAMSRDEMISRRTYELLLSPKEIWLGAYFRE
jgi:hypothetical protein